MARCKAYKLSGKACRAEVPIGDFCQAHADHWKRCRACKSRWGNWTHRTSYRCDQCWVSSVARDENFDLQVAEVLGSGAFVS